eukprot:s7271_g3.t1
MASGLVNLLNGVAHGEAIVLEAVLRLDFQLVRLIFGAELLLACAWSLRPRFCFLHHAVDQPDAVCREEERVVKVCAFFVGIVVFRARSFVKDATV